MTDTRETAARVAVEIADLVGFDPTVQNAAGRRVEDIVDEALRNERERAAKKAEDHYIDSTQADCPGGEHCGRTIAAAIRNPKGE